MNISLTEAFIELTVSIMIFIGCMATALVYAYQFVYAKNKDLRKSGDYFKYNTMFNILFNALCSLFVMAYFMWIVIDPLPGDMLYFFHDSHQLRIVITVLWYASKIFPFLIFNGRLKFAFKRGFYATSKTLFWALNVIVLLLTPASLTVGYLGVFVYPNPYLQWIGFNLYRIIYICLLLLLSCLFNKRIFLIVSTRASWGDFKNVRDATNTTAAGNRDRANTQSEAPEHSETCKSETSQNQKAKDVEDSQQQKVQIQQQQITEIMEYLNVVVKSSLLLTFMIVSKVLVMAVWFLHNAHGFAHITLTVGFVVMAFDSLVDQVCVVLLYRAFEPYYAVFCGCTNPAGLNNINETHGVHALYAQCCTFCAACYSKRRNSETD
eukprot:CAMPEP_0197055738 /NCGR_PEP_ID=MMETSP1384-20130603/72316_1 /TAXON_ID=29189 /ORGANISM="Ammonia sp." /LENGTH=378 /DNA_ID=CAMNT_0042489411 /DNA_START=39 /DNA_END=1175 /DNA_ORIENTATION=+